MPIPEDGYASSRESIASCTRLAELISETIREEDHVFCRLSLRFHGFTSTRLFAKSESR